MEGSTSLLPPPKHADDKAEIYEKNITYIKYIFGSSVHIDYQNTPENLTIKTFMF